MYLDFNPQKNWDIKARYELLLPTRVGMISRQDQSLRIISILPAPCLRRSNA
jgi:hypothetical protein